jgi:FG-GAP-like repeat
MPAPSITGLPATQTTLNNLLDLPFLGVSVLDPTPLGVDVLTITVGDNGADGTLSGLGLTGGANGVYTLTGLTALINTELDLVQFAPATGALGTTTIASLGLSVLDTVSGLLGTASTLVSDIVAPLSPVLPTILGAHATSTSANASVDPFVGVTIGDANPLATDTLTITLSNAANGALSGLGLTGGQNGVYTLSGLATAITTELDLLRFTPTIGAPGSTSTTTFTLSDVSNAILTPVINALTTVTNTVAPVDNTSILWQNDDGQAAVWNLTGTTLTGGGPVTPNPGPSWREVGAGDFNSDGQQDILWQNRNTGQASIWEMNGNTLIGGGPVTPNPDTTWQAVGTGDFNADGRSDILWQNTDTGQASIWEMNGKTLIGGGSVSPNPGPSWRAVGTGDFNDDGHSDIVWQNSNTGQVSIWEMKGNSLIGGGPVTPNPGADWRLVGTGDFNHDNHADLLWQNKSSGQISVWEMNGTTLTGGGQTLNPGPSWRAVGTDGGSHILFQNTSGQTSIWEMNGNTIIGGGPVSPNPGPTWHATSLT